MGSFNSAPKINNIDSQDDDVDVPNGLQTTADLVNHCKLMRGDNRPELLQRSFFKPINDLSPNDVTDGLRYLHLNSVSKGNKKSDTRTTNRRLNRRPPKTKLQNRKNESLSMENYLFSL